VHFREPNHTRVGQQRCSRWMGDFRMYRRHGTKVIAHMINDEAPAKSWSAVTSLPFMEESRVEWALRQLPAESPESQA